MSRKSHFYKRKFKQLILLSYSVYKFAVPLLLFKVASLEIRNVLRVNAPIIPFAVLTPSYFNEAVI